MELKHRTPLAMLGAAARVSLAAWTVFASLALIGAAYECALQRYDVVSVRLDSVLARVVGENAAGTAEVKPAPLVNSSEELTKGLKRLRLVPLGNLSRHASSSEDGTPLLHNSRFSRRSRERRPDPGLVFGVMVLLGLVLFYALYLVACLHAAMLGIICFSAVLSYMGKPVKLRKVARACFSGAGKQIVRLALLQAVFRGLLGTLFVELFLKRSKDAESLLVQLSSMPWAFLAPLRDRDIINSGMAGPVAAFLFFDYLLDGLVWVVYVVACWVTMMEPGCSGYRSLQRSWSLLKVCPVEAVTIKLLEGLLRGKTFQWLVEKALGEYASLLVAGAATTYFTILWVVFYMSARCKQQQQQGEPSRFNHDSLKVLVERYQLEA